MSHNNDPIEINSPLTKEDITQIVNSETMQQAIKDSHDTWEKTKFKLQIFVALIMAFSAAFGYYLKWDSDRKDRIEQQIQAANERRAEEIQARINLKMEWMKNTNSSIKNMRKTRELIILDCQFNHTPSQYEQEKERFIARDDVARSFDGIKFIFNDNVQQAFLKFTSFDEKIRDVCAKNAPSDIQWHTYENNLNALMENSIYSDNLALSNISSKNN